MSIHIISQARVCVCVFVLLCAHLQDRETPFEPPVHGRAHASVSSPWGAFLSSMRSVYTSWNCAQVDAKGGHYVDRDIGGPQVGRKLTPRQLLRQAEFGARLLPGRTDRPSARDERRRPASLRRCVPQKRPHMQQGGRSAQRMCCRDPAQYEQQEQPRPPLCPFHFRITSIKAPKKQIQHIFLFSREDSRQHANGFSI